MRFIDTNARRRGVTLTEALIAVGIMAVGLLALMTFFPLAAVQMARSFKDDRTGALAANADNLYRTIWREIWYDPASNGLLRQERTVLQGEPSLQALDDIWFNSGFGSLLPNPTNPPNYNLVSPYSPGPPYRDGGTGNANAPTAFNGSTGVNGWFDNAYPQAVRGNTFWPSFPVLIDPIGFRVRAGNTRSRHWVGNTDSLLDTGAEQFFLARRTLNALDATTTSGASRYCTLLDDLTFQQTGVPDTVVDRAGKYNCAWLIQRSRNSVRLSLDITVLTFQGRPGSDIEGQERSARITSGNNAESTSLNVFFNGGGADLPVHRGSWIILLNMSNPTDANFPNVPDSRRFISFHRVLSIVDNAGGNYTVELQQPVPKLPNVVGQPTHILMMEGLVEVFEAGRITLKTPPKP